jgi:hypothetical protein
MESSNFSAQLFFGGLLFSVLFSILLYVIICNWRGRTMKFLFGIPFVMCIVGVLLSTEFITLSEVDYLDLSIKINWSARLWVSAITLLWIGNASIFIGWPWTLRHYRRKRQTISMDRPSQQLQT